MSLTHPQVVANDNIRPFRFCKPDDSGTPEDFYVKEANANEKIIGIAGEGTNMPPLSDLVTTAYAAQAGQSFRMNGNGEVCLLEIGAAVAAGTYLKSDNEGRGVEIATTGTTLQRYGAMALQHGAAAGEKIRVQVMIGSERPAIA